MTVYDVILDDKLEEVIKPISADLFSLFHIMRDHWLPKMTAKYGQDVILKRREAASLEAITEMKQQIEACHAQRIFIS